MAPRPSSRRSPSAVLLAGVVGGAVFFALLQFIDEPALLLGGIVGAMLGGVALVIEHQLDRLAAGTVFAGPWVFATLFGAALTFGWSHDRLSGRAAGDIDTVAGDGPAGRRRFLMQLGGTAFLTSLISTIAGLLFAGRSDDLTGTRWSDTHGLPNAGEPVVPVPGTRAEFTPIDRHYRVDTNTRAPRIDPAEWRLRAGGMIQKPLAFTLEELRQHHDPLHQFVTLSCISNPPGGDLISTTRWTGVSLKRLLPELIMHEAATHLLITSADGFTESVAIADIRADERIMLTYAWDGVPLPIEHGFPLRLYAPGLYGMKQPKWIVALDAVDRWQPGYWVARGWDREGRVKVSSAIDIVRASSTPGRVELGGIAFAGSRGISKVEIQVDDGAWQKAELRGPLSPLTWLIWRGTLPASGGDHVFAVRAYDGQGRMQDAGLQARRWRV